MSFCGPEVTPKFHTQGNYSGWKLFAQLFNPFVIPRCIVNVNDSSSAYVLVLLLNREVVQEQFELSSFETLASRVRYALQSES